MATTAESGGGDVLRSERIAGGILPKVLNSFFGLVASGVGVYVTFTGPWTTLISYASWLYLIGGIAILSLLIGAILFFDRPGNDQRRCERRRDYRQSNRLKRRRKPGVAPPMDNVFMYVSVHMKLAFCLKRLKTVDTG
jgi:hypothetical protein